MNSFHSYDNRIERRVFVFGKTGVTCNAIATTTISLVELVPRTNASITLNTHTRLDLLSPLLPNNISLSIYAFAPVHSLSQIFPFFMF